MQGIYLRDSSNNVVTGNDAYLNSQFGIYLWNSSNNTIKGNNVTSNTNTGIGLVFSSDNNTISGNNASSNIINGIAFNSGSSNNTVTGNNVSGSSDGIKVVSSSNNNTITGNNVTLNNNGIHLDVSASYNDIIGNNVTENNNGIVLRSSSNNNIITGNNVSSNTNRGIYLETSSYNNITGNNVSLNTDGIYLDSSSYCNITGNNVTLNTNIGIYLETSSNNNITSNNVFVNTMNGIFLNQTSNDNTVTGNNVSSSFFNGIYLNASLSNDITGNNVFLNSWNGIHIISTSNLNNIIGNNVSSSIRGFRIHGSSNNNITGNNVSSNSYGIYLESSTYINITGNNVSSNLIDGIHLLSSSNNNITGNNVSSNPRNGTYISTSSNNNTLKGNVISNSGQTGINITGSLDNKIYDNEIINNNIQAFDDSNNGNRWNYTYYWDSPRRSGGNHWSDFDEAIEGCDDDNNGSATPQIGGPPDGICDIQYDIDADSADKYPLTEPPDLYPPEIVNVLIDGAPSRTYTTSALPPTFFLNATIDDTNTGGSNISGANHTLGAFNWPSSQPMNAVDGTWNDTVENVTVTIATPAVGGTYTYCVYAWDNKSNLNTTSTACAQLNITDDSSPEITNALINGSVAQTYMLSNLPSSLILNATINDTNTGGSNISGANHTLGAFNWPSNQTMNAVDGTWDDDIMENVTATIATPVMNGTYDYCVYAWDNASNYNTTSTECAQLTVIDDLPPEIHNVKVDGQDFVIVDAGTPVILSATVNDTLFGGTNLAGANYTIGAGNWTSATMMNATSPPFDSPVENVNVSVDTTGWPVDVYELYVYGWDQSMGYNTSSVAYAEIIITADATPPTISNEQPPDASTTNLNFPTISANYSDVSGIDIASVVLKVNGIEVTPQILTAAGVSYTPTMPLPDNMQGVELKVNDTFGNQATLMWSFRVDTTPPTISNRQPTDTSKTNDNTPTIGASYNDISDIDTFSVVLKLDGVVVVPQTLTSSAVSYTPSTLSDGPYNVELRVNDSVGNQRIVTWSFTVDATPPLISNHQPIIDSKITDNTPTIGVNYSDVSGIETTSVVLKIDGIVVTPQTLTASGVTYTPTNALSDGNHDIELSVRDNVDNLVIETWSFTIDSTAPFTNAGVNIEINVGDTVNFNGNASSDNIDVTAQLNFTWEIFKDGALITTLYGISPSYVFNEAGKYDVNLTVRDSTGNEGHDSTTVTVATPGEEQGADYWWILVIVAVVIVVVLLILFMLMRKKKPAETPPPEPYSPSEIQAEYVEEEPAPPGDVPSPPPPIDQAKGEVQEGAAMVSNCPLCSAKIPPGERTCPDCGYEFTEGT
jgi:parallel beta-helix repeat protein